MTPLAKKEIAVVVAATLFSAVVIVAYRLLLPLAVANWASAAGLFLLILIWQAGLMVALALGRRKGATAALCLIPALIVAVLGELSGVAIGGAVLLIIFSVLAARTLVRDEANRLYYRTTDLFTNATRLLSLGLLIALTSLAWPVLTDSVKSTRFMISEQQVAPFLKPIEPVIQDFFPGYTATASIDELLDKSLAEEKKNLPPGVVIDPVQEQRMREDLKKRLGENITGQEGLATVVAGKINDQINSLATQSPVQASLLLAVLVFLTLRALLPFIVWPTLALIALLVKIAVAARLAGIQTETVARERLRL